MIGSNQQIAKVIDVEQRIHNLLTVTVFHYCILIFAEILLGEGVISINYYENS